MFIYFFLAFFEYLQVKLVSLCRFLFLLFNFVSAQGQNDFSNFVLFTLVYLNKLQTQLKLSDIY